MIRKSVSLAQHGTVPKEREKRLEAILKPGRVHSMHLQWVIDNKNIGSSLFCMGNSISLLSAETDYLRAC